MCYGYHDPYWLGLVSTGTYLGTSTRSHDRFQICIYNFSLVICVASVHTLVVKSDCCQ
jgi:hypothetical protein